MPDQWMALAGCLRRGGISNRCARQAAFIDVTHGQQQEIDMNQDRFEGNWKQLSGKVREQWGRRTNDPQRELAGRRDQLAGRIQERYGISNEEAARQLNDFLDRNSNWWDLSKR
jgi:uncharacterized protein YjbJ (UPF0337 family)